MSIHLFPKHYNNPVDEVIHMLRTSLESGLSSEEAEKRLEQYGYNEFEKKKYKSLLVKFLEQFKRFMIIVLLIAAVISGIVGCMNDEGFIDAVIMLVIIVL